MTEEPLYRYVKGEGWVIVPAVETRTAELGIYRFTLEKRTPIVGEHWTFYNNDDIDTFFKYYKEFWNWSSTRLPQVICKPFKDFGKVPLHEDEHVYTIKLELL